MNSLVEDIKKDWGDGEKLQQHLLAVIDVQFKLSDAIASAERSFSEAFLTERESMFKGSDSLARQRAKSLVGTQQTQYEYDFQVYTNLIQVVTFRISQLSQVRVKGRSGLLSPLSAATSETDV